MYKHCHRGVRNPLAQDGTLPGPLWLPPEWIIRHNERRCVYNAKHSPHRSPGTLEQRSGQRAHTGHP